ncbi:MAG TPA: hypothetical protein VEU76_03555 [Candidatus Udaeobacter sp.]|nr:hypothetical protein [Candidatus Udaeobacter sp.]
MEGGTQDDSGRPRVERRISSPEHRAAYAAAKAAPAQHKPKLITSRSVHQQVHGQGGVGRLNTWLAVTITKSVGTMWAAYLFTLIAVGGAVAVVTNNAFLTALSVLISQTFLQLVLLPIIIVGQNVISEAQDARAEQDHLTLTTLHAINVQQLKMLEQQRAILELLQKQAGIATTTQAGG